MNVIFYHVTCLLVIKEAFAIVPLALCHEKVGESLKKEEVIVLLNRFNQ